MKRRLSYTIRAFDILNYEKTWVLTDVKDSNYDIKPRSYLLTLSAALYDVSALCNRFLKAVMHQFGASGTEGLTTANQPGSKI